MGILDNIQANSGPRALKVVIHGENGIGKTTFAAVQASQQVIAEQQAGIATGACLGDAHLEALTGELRAQAQGMQQPLVEGQPGAHRIQPLRRQAVQA